MTQEADFCGDRLRLSAFLRVVADGMPQRPTRFKRRFIGIHRSRDSSIQRDTVHSDASIQKAAHERCPSNTTFLDMIRSPSPRPPELGAEDLRLTTQANSGSRKDRKQSKFAQPSEDQHHTGEQVSITAINKPLGKSRKISSAPKSRYLPVNELALLITTSSDGLPLPSGVFAVSVAVLDPIEDKIIRSATPSKISSGRSFSYRVKKASPVRVVKPGSPAWLLNRRSARSPPVKHIGTLNNMSLRHSLATASDGFVDVELDLQHPTSRNKPGASNKKGTKKSVCSHGELVLGCGYLPPPSIEPEHSGLAMTEPHLHTADFRASGTPGCAGKTLPRSQRAVERIHDAIKEQEARERRQLRVRQHHDLVRGQLSNVAAPNRHTSEFSSSDSADEDTIFSRRSTSGLDESHEQGTLQWPDTPLTGRAHWYFGPATRDLDTAGRSDSVNGEFWEQYGQLERNDGQWDTHGAIGLPHYI